MAIIVGVDPGKNGGIFRLSDDLGMYEHDYMQMSLIKPKSVLTLKKDAKGKRIKKQPKTKPDYDDIKKEFGLLVGQPIKNGRHVEAVIERVAARPGQGGVSMFNFGMVYGFVYGMILAWGIPVTFVNPAVWKEGVGLPKESDGKASRDLAATLFPKLDFSMAKYEGVAEAGLIAHYHQQQSLTKDL